MRRQSNSCLTNLWFWNSSHSVSNIQLVEICHCWGIFDYFANGDIELIICTYCRNVRSTIMESEGRSRWYLLFCLLQTCYCFLDLYIKQYRGLHALSILLLEDSARSVPSLTKFSLLDAEKFDEDCHSGSGPSWGKRFGNGEAYDWLVRSRIVYRYCITKSKLFRNGT